MTSVRLLLRPHGIALLAVCLLLSTGCAKEEVVAPAGATQAQMGTLKSCNGNGSDPGYGDPKPTGTGTGSGGSISDDGDDQADKERSKKKKN